VCLNAQVHDVSGETTTLHSRVRLALSELILSRLPRSKVGNTQDLVAATHTGTSISRSTRDVAKHTDLLA
jgi:hypothetical protein